MLSNFIGLTAFLTYLGFAALATVVFVAVYLWITPQRELRLIAQGNLSAAVSFGGVILGFVLPVSSALAHSVSLEDLAAWSAVAFAVQIITFVLIRIAWRDHQAAIEKDNRAVAVLTAVLSVSVGMLNAAAMTY